MFEIKMKLKTKSNCLVGNQTERFSIGGVDQSTVINVDGKPMICGSSFKGAIRNIVRENDEEMGETKKYIEEILQDLLNKYRDIEQIDKTEKIEKLINKVGNYANNVKAEYIFGIEGLNGMSRIFCTDFVFSEDNENKDYFLIETKTSLEEVNGEILSRPRTYKVIRPGVIFEGTVRFQNNYYTNKKVNLEKVESEIKNMLLKFNEGFYGIGNSKSRGYGSVEICILD